MVSSTGLVIEWEDVTETIDSGSLTITGYEVIITEESENQTISVGVFKTAS